MDAFRMPSENDLPNIKTLQHGNDKESSNQASVAFNSRNWSLEKLMFRRLSVSARQPYEVALDGSKAVCVMHSKGVGSVWISLLSLR